MINIAASLDRAIKAAGVVIDEIGRAVLLMMACPGGEED